MIRSLFRKLLWLALAAALLGATGIVTAYLLVAGSLPKVDTLADYRPPIITRILSDDGTVIAEIYKERRILVPVERIPRQLIHAFVAAEDSKFFEHRGIDLVSIFRAALKNIQAGGIVQGGSTITQQVAKSLLLTPEKKFERKFKEAILAWRMEQKLSKEEILYLYLNQIYLGHGAHGIQAAAENYFAKNVEDLTLAESAILAGLPQAPSRYSPYRHFQRAKDRQHYVLKRMVEDGYISEAEAEQAEAEQVVIHPRVNQHVAEAAYFTEQVRRDLVETYGAETVLTQGLEVHTSLNLEMQRAAQQAVRENLRNYDKRQGYRGPQKILSEADTVTFLAEQTRRLQRRPPAAGDYLRGILTGFDSRVLQVTVGDRRGLLPRDSFKWAGNLRFLSREDYLKTPEDPESDQILVPIGSVLELRVNKVRPDGSLELSLEQTPKAQGALVALDPQSGQVKAMVGGFDFADSQFNRVTQARRLPGSAMKPLIYAAALDKGYTPATVILDTPIIYKETRDSGEETEWKPRNYGKKFYGPTSLRTGLTHSRNIITIKILEDIGVNYAANYARRLGIVSPLTRDLTLGLGSSAVTPIEMAKVYAVFANGGIKVSPAYITRILDRDGKVIASVDPADFPDGAGPGQRLLQQRRERVISPETAYLITNLLESVVQHGTGWRAKALGRPVAGKTGTTNDLKDAWFIGFIPQLVAVTWTGYDQERSLGKQETGSRAAAPAWVAFMRKASKKFRPRQFRVPDSIEFRSIDPKTGLLVPEDTPDAIIEAFAPGTAPTRYALDEDRPKARDFFKLDLEEN
ncbi:penicillin-binding protein [Geothermobacter hydrogeniphilus]|uniref:peptidoglycan glycosyltransferase n=1 Tax=Geothermobacter hydrogeniphilus TaxID=1969733 RepID=A0A2K2HAW6_9BACT|nr:PBP1A family penicillin-binding protein [Geothermobacter hydrogeniphilus]PNU20379.1 penicillin-binding protein [Geothermobacter hydrogeniphilus]